MNYGPLFRTIPLAIASAFAALTGVNSIQAADSMNGYPAPKGAALNNSFSAKVRAPGGAWQDVAIYDVRVNLLELSQAAFAYFDFTGKAEVQVTFNGGAVKTAEVRPKSFAIVPRLEGAALTFALDQPQARAEA